MQLEAAPRTRAASLGGLALLFLSPLASAQVVAKTITYTRFAGPPDNVRKVEFLYDPSMRSATFGASTTITSTPGADGVLFAPDGDLIIGGQANAVHKVQPSGSFTTVTAGGVDAYHVMLDPSGRKVWTAAIPGFIAEVPLNPFANGTAHTLSGDDTAVTHIAFAGNRAYYTSSGILGLGNFGTIDLTTFTTTRLFTDVTWAHGMTYDCYTQDIMVFANGYVAQFDPDTDTVVSILDASPLNLVLDQGTSDGEGHLFIASNTGHMLFVDLTISGMVGAPDFTDAPFLDSFVDDIAPDCGLGGPTSPALSQGYWKNHPSAWPVQSLTLGCRTYTKAECLTLLGLKVQGDASRILAKQLIAAKLNVANNSLNWPVVTPFIEQADALLCTYPGALPLAVPASSVNGALMSALAARMEGYNSP